MSRHTFALVGPSRYGVENQEIATGVGVKWKGCYLILTAGHVVDYCSEDTLRFFLPAGDIQLAPQDFQATVEVEVRRLFELRNPRPPIFAEYPIDLAAIVLPPQQPSAEGRFATLDERATMPPEGKQVGVFGYPGAGKIPIGLNYMAGPSHFFGPLDSAGDICSHEPQQDFNLPYILDHRANGFSGSGVWSFRSELIWSPEPQLCGILATECTIDKVVSGFGIQTIVNFLKENEAFLLE